MKQTIINSACKRSFNSNYVCRPHITLKVTLHSVECKFPELGSPRVHRTFTDAANEVTNLCANIKEALPPFENGSPLNVPSTAIKLCSRYLADTFKFVPQTVLR